MRKAIAIDFDGCLCTDEFPAVGEPNWPVIYRAKTEQRAGAGLILWTCREDQLLLDAIAACENWGLAFDAINESLPDWIEAFGTRPRKVGATEYWDNKAVRIPAALRFFVGGAGDDSIELFEPTPDNRLPDEVEHLGDITSQKEADMDYKELVELLRKYPEKLIAAYTLDRGFASACHDAATAIETLLAERDALCSLIRERPLGFIEECVQYENCYAVACENGKVMNCLLCKN